MDAIERSRRRARVAAILLVVYVVFVALVALWPTRVDRGVNGLVHLLIRHVPLLTYDRLEFAANIMFFVPLGLLLALMLERSRYLVLPIALVATVAIECTQAALLSQRSPSVLDIVANTTGAAVGLIIAGIIDARRKPVPDGR